MWTTALLSIALFAPAQSAAQGGPTLPLLLPASDVGPLFEFIQVRAEQMDALLAQRSRLLEVAVERQPSAAEWARLSRELDGYGSLYQGLLDEPFIDSNGVSNAPFRSGFTSSASVWPGIDLPGSPCRFGLLELGRWNARWALAGEVQPDELAELLDRARVQQLLAQWDLEDFERQRALPLFGELPMAFVEWPELGCGATPFDYSWHSAELMVRTAVRDAMALIETLEMLDGLALKSLNGTLNDNDRHRLDFRFQLGLERVSQIVVNADYQGRGLLDAEQAVVRVQAAPGVRSPFFLGLPDLRLYALKLDESSIEDIVNASHAYNALAFAKSEASLAVDRLEQDAAALGVALGG